MNRRSSRPSVEAITSTRGSVAVQYGALRCRRCLTRLRDRPWDGGCSSRCSAGAGVPRLSQRTTRPAATAPATAPTGHGRTPFEARRPERSVPTMPRSERHSRIGARAVDHSSPLTTADCSATPRSEPRLTAPPARCQARRTARHPRPPAFAHAPRRSVWWPPADRSCPAAPCSGRHEQSSALRSSSWYPR